MHAARRTLLSIVSVFDYADRFVLAVPGVSLVFGILAALHYPLAGKNISSEIRG